MTSYQVIFDFQGSDSEELSVIVGEILESHEEPSGGWIRVKRVSDGQEGFVPESYLQQVETSEQEMQHLNIGQNVNNSPSTSGYEGADSTYQESIPVGGDCSNFDNKNHTLVANQFNRKASSTFSTGTLRVIGDPYLNDPIKNIVGSTILGKFRSSGIENFMVGLATGKHTQSAIQYDANENKVVGSAENCEWSVGNDEGFQVVVANHKQDPQTRTIYYEIHADPWPSSFQINDPNTRVRRKLTDCHWLDKRLRVKYPFIYSRDSHRKFFGQSEKCS